MRRRWFRTNPVELTAEANAGSLWFARAFAAALLVYAQPGLPQRPAEHPLIELDALPRSPGDARLRPRPGALPSRVCRATTRTAKPHSGRLARPETVVGAAGMMCHGRAHRRVVSWLRFNAARIDLVAGRRLCPRLDLVSTFPCRTFPFSFRPAVRRVW